VPYLVRLGCAAVAVVAIAVLTSIGLYAVVAGGVLFGAPSPRTTPASAPVLVTIQAAPVTPTAVLISTSTPMPSSLIPGLGQPAVSALVPPSSPAAATPSPTDVASPPTHVASLTVPPEPGRQAAHDGLTLEILEVERGWQARMPDGSPFRGRDGQELLTVHVRLLNRAAELRFAADGDLVLVADDGARYAPRQGPPLREPHLLTVPVPLGESVRGWLTYDTPAGTTPRRLQWSLTRPDRPRADSTYLLALP
jgi:hypothetical protein